MTILVVDDETEYRLVLRSVLMSEGHTAVTAEHGEEALKRLEEHPVDLVISDIYMPIMDGIKFHRALRAIPKYERLPFLFISAFDDQYVLEAIQDARHDGFLRKARPVQELKEWIEYLTQPEDKHFKPPPSSLRTRSGGPARRERS
jgi:CheY-like chemotaxis protein